MLATKTSRPRIEERQSEKADRSRRTEKRPVADPERGPPALAQVVTGGVSGRSRTAVRPRSYFEG